MSFEAKILRCIQRALDLTTKFGVLPIQLDVGERRFRFNRARSFWVQFGINMALALFVEAGVLLMVYVMYYMVVNSELPTVCFGFGCVCLLLMAGGIVVDILFGWQGSAESFVFFANSMLRLEDKHAQKAFGDSWTQRDKHDFRKAEAHLLALLDLVHKLLVWFLVPGAAVILLMYQSALVIIFQNMARLFLDLELSYELSTTLFWPLFALYLYMAPGIIFRWNALLSITVTFAWYFNQMLHVRLTSMSLRNLQLTDSLLHVYNSLMILNDNLIGFTASLWSGGTFMAGFISTLGIFFLFQGLGPVENFLILVIVCTCSCASALLHVLGMVTSLSKELLASWRAERLLRHRQAESGQAWKFTERRYRNLHPLQVSFSSAYSVTETSALTYWDTIIDKTILLLYM